MKYKKFSTSMSVKWVEPSIIYNFKAWWAGIRFRHDKAYQERIVNFYADKMQRDIERRLCQRLFG